MAMKAAAAAGSGGRPVRAKDVRRSQSEGEAGGARGRLREEAAVRMRESMGCSSLRGAGMVGDWGVMKAQCFS